MLTVQIIADQIEAEPAFLMSFIKPVLMLAVIGPWAWMVGRLDKDAEFFFLKRDLWGSIHIAAGFFALLVILLIPIFWIGWIMGIGVLLGEAYAYVHFRNKEVPEKARWHGMDIIRHVQSEREAKASKKAIVESDVKLLDKDDRPMKIPHGEDPRVPAFDLFSKLLSFAAPRGADRLEIVVDASKAVFSARIDGIRYPQEAPEPELCVQLIDYLKENGGMDTKDRRRKQTGRMAVEVEGIKHELVLTTAGSTKALQLVIDVDPIGRLDIPLKHLGLLPRQLEQVTELTEQTEKVVIFASPPQTGVTTTSYAVLQKHDPYTSSVVTYERSTPFPLEGVNHTLFPEGASNEQILTQFEVLMRGDPNVLFVSHLVSTDMAKAVARDSHDTRMYLPLAANDTLAGLKTWMKVVGDKKLAGESLAAIISQRLIRKLCLTCRAPYEPDAAAMKKLNMPKDGGHLYKASGKVMIKEEQEPCPQCHGIGYRGRVGVFEIMYLDDQAREKIAAGDGEGLRMHLRKQNMVYLQEAALAKVVEGVSDIKEVTRVMSENQKG